MGHILQAPTVRVTSMNARVIHVFTELAEILSMITCVSVTPSTRDVTVTPRWILVPPIAVRTMLSVCHSRITQIIIAIARDMDIQVSEKLLYYIPKNCG